MTAMEEAKSVISKALAVTCAQCQALVGEPCKQSDGQLLAFKGHLGVHWARMSAARHIKSATA